MSAKMKSLFETASFLPDAEQVLVEELLKRIILAWDPDFTKATPTEKLAIDEGLYQIKSGETISAEELYRQLGI
ncbi:MAG: hypothetical protein FWD06_08990 [Oscillospiraceae bacterium]|nr:hypothetical protein [Oscillospiraceae bacterium]